MLRCGLLFLWWIGFGGVWDRFVTRRFWLLRQVSIGTLVSGDVGSGLVIGKLVTWTGFHRFGAYGFAMAVGFGDATMWPILSSLACRRQSACLVYYWAGSGSQGGSRLYALGGVAVASWLEIVRVEMGPSYCQFDGSGFMMVGWRAPPRCGLLWLQRLGTGGM